MQYLIISAIYLCVIRGFSLPGIQQKEYVEGERIEVFMNEMTSVSTQIPYDYYDLDICRPSSIENQN